MKNSIKKFADGISAAIGSRRFFVAVIVFFVVEALWIAFSAVYPQAFDEQFHFGIIRVYSHHWLPFLTSQPPGANAYGAVARDPSYLYQYLLSFPYRVTALFTHNQTAQVIVLRIINIAFFASGLVLFQRVMVRAGMSRKLAHMTLLIFALIPIAPQLAGQINYDNLVFPLVAVICLLTFQMIDELRRRQPSAKTALTLLSVCTLTTMVKYAFLPIFVAVVLYVAGLALWQFRGRYKSLWFSLWESWQSQSRLSQIVLLVVLVIGLGLFLQRDGVNYAVYHRVVPDCAQVLPASSCEAYLVWQFNNMQRQFVNNHSGAVHFENIVAYVGDWFYYMWFRLFFAVNGPTSDFNTIPPLPLPAAGALVIAVVGLAALIKAGRKTFHNNPYMTFLALAALLYAVVLLLDGYAVYKNTNVQELMNGRYLLPILPMAAVVIGRVCSLTLRRRPHLKLLMVAVVAVLFIEGGGVLTFILRSDASWDWPNHAVVMANNAARDILHPVILDGTSSFPSSGRWFFD